MFTYTVQNTLECLQSLVKRPCGKSRVEKQFGKFLAEDIEPLLRGDYSRIRALEHEYYVHDTCHTMDYDRFCQTPREVRLLRGETTSYMTDKMLFYEQAYYYMSILRTLLEEGNPIEGSIDDHESVARV